MGNNIARSAFTFYSSWYEAISTLDDQSRLEVYDAIASYSLCGNDPVIRSEIAKLCWRLIKPTIDKARVRSAAGSGEKPSLRGNKNASKNEQKTNKKRTKNDVGKDKGKGKDIEIDFIEPADAGKTKHSSTDIEQLTDEQQAFIDELRRDFPSVMSMQQPLTFEQCQRLADSGFGTDQVRDVLGQMENFVQLKKKYKSAYATALNWLKRNGK